MNERLGVTARELIEALSRSAIPLPYEIGTFIALEACEGLVGDPAEVDLEHVWVAESGEVLVSPETSVDEAAAARSVVTLLGQLLVQSAPGVPPMLLELVERGPSDGGWELSPLRDALEASLVPLNRAATQRVLARILREARRGRPQPETHPDERGVAGELDALLDVDAAHADRIRDHREQKQRARQVDASSGEGGGPSEDVEGAVVGTAGSSSDREIRSQGLPGAAQVPPGVAMGADDLAHLEESAPSRRRWAWVWMAVLVVMVGGIAFLFARGTGGGRTLSRTGRDPSASSARTNGRGVAPSGGSLRVGKRDLAVTTRPHGAQVLMRIGRAGAPLQGFAIGEAHELVVLAGEGKAVRVAISADADWGDDRHMTLALPGASDWPFEGADLGPSQLEPALGARTGALGTVTVEGDEQLQVYKLVGLTGPASSVTLEGLPFDRDLDLLIVRRGYQRESLRLSRAQLAAATEPLSRSLALTAL